MSNGVGTGFSGSTVTTSWPQIENVTKMRAALIELLIYAEKCDDLLDDRCPDLGHRGLVAAREVLGMISHEDTLHGHVVREEKS